MASQDKSKDKKKGDVQQANAMRVRCPGGAFRRGGHAFGVNPIVLMLADLTELQAKAIADEPLLAVEFINVEVAAEESTATNVDGGDDNDSEK